MSFKIMYTAILLSLMGITGCSSKAERGFRSSCQSGGLDRSTCSCIYDSLEDHYGANKLEKMMSQDVDIIAMRNVLPPDFGNVFTRSVQQCARR